MSGAVYDGQIAESFEKQGYLVFKQKNNCEVFAVKSDMALAYIVGCKDYELTRKQQILAVRELNRNYTHGLELLIKNRLCAEKF